MVPAGRVAIHGAMFGLSAFEPLAPVEYRVGWAQPLARTYGVDGQASPRCAPGKSCMQRRGAQGLVRSGGPVGRFGGRERVDGPGLPLR